MIDFPVAQSYLIHLQDREYFTYIHAFFFYICSLVHAKN